MDLTAFAAEVGPLSAGPVAAAGGLTQWDVGGESTPGTRLVHAPAGIDWIEPAEMTVRCGAGTTVADLATALAEQGQRVALPEWPGATVGGVLAVGRSGIRRLGDGPVRDAVLQIGAVRADGEVVTAGGPTVKNVSGYDLCRLFVGSLGTLVLLGDVILRTRPLPAARQWLAGPTPDPFALRRRLDRPTTVLWDGTTCWVLLEGHPLDVAAEAALARADGLVEVEGAPPLPSGDRRSIPPAEVRHLRGRFVAEVGVGVVHRVAPVPGPQVAPNPSIIALHGRLRERFDPTGRLNPGRSVLTSG